MSSFGARLSAALDAHGPLCVGIDPHAALLDDWSLSQDAAGVREFGLRVVEAAAGRVAIVKPQVSFFERFGSRGFAALEDVLASARKAGLLVVADAKRGDIGSTMDGYADAWLGEGSPLEADAVTLSPYLGGDSLRGVLTRALRAGKGAFVLTATSNPEGAVVQRARTDDPAAGPDERVAERVARDVSWLNPSMTQHARLGSIGVVLGSTVDRTLFGLDDDLLRTAPILAPGFGAQGASPGDLVSRFRGLAGNVLASESRSILSAGPHALAEVIDTRAAEYREVLGA